MIKFFMTEALESCRLDNASGSSFSVVMNGDFDDEHEAAKELGGDGGGGSGGARRAHFNNYDLKQQFDSNSSVRWQCSWLCPSHYLI